MQLSQHFALREFVVSAAHPDLAKKIQPTAQQVMNLQRLAKALERARALLGRPLVILSGLRSPELNAADQGKPNSDHLAGLAADVAVTWLAEKEFSLLAARLFEAVPELRQVICYPGRHFVHLAVAADFDRRARGCFEGRADGTYAAIETGPAPAKGRVA